MYDHHRTDPAHALPFGFRIAVLGTPVCGTDWLTLLLGAAYELPIQAADVPSDVPWNALPPECLVRVPCLPSPAVAAVLGQQGFHNVLLLRHPLDVLVTVLHHGWFSRSCDRWLEGEGGTERPLLGAWPRSQSFRDFVAGRRVAALLGIGPSCSRMLDCACIQYEHLIHDPAGTLQQLEQRWSRTLRRTAVEAVAHVFRTSPSAGAAFPSLGWPRTPGLWRTLLPAALAQDLFQAVRCHDEEGRYECHPDPTLTESQADENWLRIVTADLAWWQNEAEAAKQGLAKAYEELHNAHRELSVLHVRFDLAQTALGRARPHPQSPLVSRRADQQVLRRRLEELELQLGSTREELRQTREELGQAQHLIADIGEVGPNSLKLAKKIRSLARPLPGLAKVVKRLMSRAA